MDTFSRGWSDPSVPEPTPFVEHDRDERLSLVIAHGGTLFAWFLAPLFVYLLKRGDSPRVACEAMQALLWSALGTCVAFATCGLAIPVFFAWHLLAAVRAFDGRPFEYPLVGDVARRIVYGR